MDDIRQTIRTRPREGAARATSAFTELAQQVRHQGLLRRRYGYYWTKLIAAPLVVAVCLAAFVWIGESWWQLFTAAALAIVFTQIAFLGHDAAHRQIFVSGRWNDWISLILGDLLVGMSYGWWQHKHTRHHANPNKLGSDPDIELPVIAVTAETAARHRGPVLAWMRGHQGVFFFPISPRDVIAWSQPPPRRRALLLAKPEAITTTITMDTTVSSPPSPATVRPGVPCPSTRATLGSVAL